MILVFYLDPPYVHETRGIRRRNASYCHEMSDHDHMMMAAALQNIEGIAVLSGYRCPMYDEMFSDWHRFDKNTYADGAQKRVESLWINRIDGKRG